MEKSNTTKEELEAWKREVTDLMSQLDSLVTELKVEVARERPRKIELLDIVDKMEELL